MEWPGPAGSFISVVRNAAHSLLLLVPVAGLSLAAPPAERSTPRSEDLRGSPLLHVLPKDEILAVYEPTFLSGEAADAQMSPDEPVLGVFDGTTAHAYSIWQLEDHEIVDDVLGDTPIAATW